MSIPFLSDALFPQLNANCHSRRHLPLPPTRAPLEMHRLLTVTAIIPFLPLKNIPSLTTTPNLHRLIVRVIMSFQTTLFTSPEQS